MQEPRRRAQTNVQRDQRPRGDIPLGEVTAATRTFTQEPSGQRSTNIVSNGSAAQLGQDNPRHPKSSIGTIQTTPYQPMMYRPMFKPSPLVVQQRNERPPPEIELAQEVKRVKLNLNMRIGAENATAK